MRSIDFHIGDSCQRQIDGVWYNAEITQMFRTFASVVYSDDKKYEDDIPLDHDNLRRPIVVVSPTTTMEDSASSVNERRQDEFVDIGISSTSTSPVSLSEEGKVDNVHLYNNDEQLSYELGSSSINLGNSRLAQFNFEFDNIQSVPYSDLPQYDKKDFVHTHLPNGDVRLRLLFIPRCGDLHSARSISKYLKMDYYWQQQQRSPPQETSGHEQRESYLIPDLKPLAGMCLMCENWTIFGCSKCFNAFYCNRKCQQRGWPHHKVYCEDAKTFSHAASFSKCNEYLQSVAYVPKQRAGMLSAACKKKPAATTNSCGTSTEPFVSGAGLAKVYPEFTPVQPHDGGGSERRVYTSPSGGSTRKVYDIRSSERPTNNSRAPPHHGHATSSNPWGHYVDSDDLDAKHHGSTSNRDRGGGDEGKLAAQWDWNKDKPIHAEAVMVGGDVDTFDGLYRVGSNNSLYCAHSVGRGSPVVEEGDDLLDDDYNYQPLDIEEGIRDDFSAFTHHTFDSLSTPPARHNHNTRSSAKSSQRSLDRGDVNSLMCTETTSQRLQPLDFSHLGSNVSQENLHELGGMGRRERSDCMSPSSYRYHHSSPHHARFQDRGYTSDSEVPELIPAHGLTSGRVTEVDPLLEESVKNLVDNMGLNETLVREALLMFPGDLDQAVNYVLNATTWD